MVDMKNIIESMKISIDCRMRADSERRANKAEHEKSIFAEKLSQAEITKIEADNLKMQIKSSDDACKRDQLMTMMIHM